MTFHAYENALELIQALRTVVPKIHQHDRKLAGHARAAASSVALNVAEGNRRRGRDRLQHFNIAAGSADEVKAALEVSLAWGYLSEDEVRRSLELVDREQRLLWGLRGG
jgi:four helix bundle protein